MVANFKIKILTVLFEFLLFNFMYIQCDCSSNEVEREIFKIQGITSFFECQAEALALNYAQKMNLPVPQIPREPITEQNVSLVIYSRQDDGVVVNTYEPNKSINNSSVNCQKATVLYVHGIHTTYTEYVSHFTALLPKEDINLIFMDWASYAFFNPTYSRNNTAPKLGVILAKFLRQYIDCGANPKHIFLIGVSTGAQIIGLAGKKLQPRVGKILGIDPVGTCYNLLPPSMRLTKSDADFVQIVHCSVGNRGELLKFQGDVTFLMNGGVIQPSCEKKGTLMEINDCSHIICGPYVYDTLKNPDIYIGVKCDNYRQYSKGNCDCNDKAVMGYYASTKSLGMYFVNTEPGQSACD